jgi:hypothetical protein
MRGAVSARSIWWGRLDWLILVPLFAVLASFWVYLAGPSLGWAAESLHEFYGLHHTAEIHSPLVIAGSIIILLYSFTLFLPGRFLFGRVARSWTVAGAILFILLATATGLAAAANYAASFL